MKLESDMNLDSLFSNTQFPNTVFIGDFESCEPSSSIEDSYAAGVYNDCAFYFPLLLSVLASKAK